MAEKVPGWMERLLLPRLSSIEGELKGFRGESRGEFKAAHSEVARLDGKVDAVNERLATKIDELDARLTARIDELDKRWDVAQRLAAVEGKVHELETRR